MVHSIDNLVVVGCSYGGPDACNYLIPKMNINRSAVVIVPHINNREIYESLLSAGVPIVGIGAESAVEPNRVYILGHDRDNILLSHLIFNNGLIKYGSLPEWFRLHFSNDAMSLGLGPIDRVMGMLLIIMQNDALALY